MNPSGPGACNGWEVWGSEGVSGWGAVIAKLFLRAAMGKVAATAVGKAPQGIHTLGKFVISAQTMKTTSGEGDLIARRRAGSPRHELLQVTPSPVSPCLSLVLMRLDIVSSKGWARARSLAVTTPPLRSPPNRPVRPLGLMHLRRDEPRL